MYVRPKLFVIVLFSLIAAPAFSSIQSDSSSTELQSLFLKRQVDQTLSVGRAIRSISSRYPQEMMSFVDIALDQYPEKYQEIIFSAVSAQPALSEEIVKIAIDKNVTSCTNIVKIAISAEPSYVDFVVQAAANATPAELDEIVRVAVITEPDSADRIVQTLAKQHPSKLVDILSTAMEAVPVVGNYMVDALLAVFPNKAKDVVTTAVKESLVQSQKIEKILASAQNQGVTRPDLWQFAIDAGATEAQITKALTTPIVD